MGVVQVIKHVIKVKYDKVVTVLYYYTECIVTRAALLCKYKLYIEHMGCKSWPKCCMHFVVDP